MEAGRNNSGVRAFVGHRTSGGPHMMLAADRFLKFATECPQVGRQYTVKPDELARSVLRLAMEGERDPVRLHDGALKGLLPTTTWREAG